MSATLALTGSLEELHGHLLTLVEAGPTSTKVTLLHPTGGANRWTMCELEREWSVLPAETRNVLKTIARKPNRIETSEVRNKVTLTGYPNPVEHALESLRQIGPSSGSITYPVDQKHGTYSMDMEFAILVLIISMSEKV
jgi:hypothetical protein